MAPPSTKSDEKEPQGPWQLARKRFFRNYPALFSAILLVLASLVGIFAYVIIPDDTVNANFQAIEAAKLPPGSKVDFLLKPRKGAPPATGFFRKMITGKEDLFLPIVLNNRTSVEIVNDTLYTGYSGLREWEFLPRFLLNIDMSHPQTTDWLNRYGSPYAYYGPNIHYIDVDKGPSEVRFILLADALFKKLLLTRRMWLGTDSYGRDVLSRLVLGTRVSLSVGFLAVIVSLFIGIFLGAIAGFFRGWVDQVVMWFVQVIWSIPTLLLAISLSFVMQKGFTQVFMAIGLSMWVEVTRIVRGQIFSIREKQFVEATRALGFTPFRTIVRHILPNVMSPVIIVAAANFAAAILIEAGLSFLGVGVQPPVPSWGGMIREGYTNIIFESGVWLAVFPGLAIVLVVISLNLVGFGLRDALDPKIDH